MAGAIRRKGAVKSLTTMGRKSSVNPKTPKKLSEGEETFALHCHLHRINVVRELRFHPDRKWRFDFALPAHKIGIEVEGGVWSNGRHNRGSGYSEDLIKYNQATLLGWRILRYTTKMVMDGTAINEVKSLLDSL